VLVRGAFRDRLLRPGRPPVEAAWRPNLVLWSALDLIGALLCNGSEGVAFLAVGSGDAAWDEAPPAPDRGRTQLTAEVARVRLVPGETLSYDAATGSLHAHVSIGPGRATGPLRELGLVGGDASPRPRSGTLLNHAVHPVLEKGEDDTLERDVVLTLDAALAPGTRELVGRLLAREPGVGGLTHIALGTGSSVPDGRQGLLAAEAYRVRIDPRRLGYDPAAHTVEASASFEVAEGPVGVSEAGLFGGTATDATDSGLLVARGAGESVDRTAPERFEQRFRLVLVERTGLAVPELVGAGLDAARAALGSAGLALGSLTRVVTEASPADSVLEQTPAANALVNEGTPVSLVAATPPTVVVPEVVGAAEEQVSALLAQLGLAVSPIEQQSPAVPGTVLAASPVPGTPVPKGSAVTLTVAVPVTVSMPDLRGRTPAAAEVVLGALGLELAPEPHPTQESGASYGTIVAQAPEPETDVEVGTTVAVTLATPWTVEVPDLAGAALDDAATTLAEAAAGLVGLLGLPAGLAGLTLGAVAERVDPAEVGTILEQNPAAGSRAWLYGTVDVVVVSPVAGAAVPDVVGLTQSSAVATLAAAGFGAGAVTERPSDIAPGTVVDQAPDAHLAWTRGDPVNLTLSATRTVSVPDVAGYALDAASETVLGLGLVLGKTTATVEPGPPTIVLGQDPAPRTAVPLGSAVALVVRAGVPNVLGLTDADARAALAAAGVPLGHEDTAESPGPVGIVLSQTPAPGTAVTASTAISLVLSIAPRVAVPNVVGSLLADATAALAAGDLVLAVTDNEESDSPPGSILSQSPVPGTRVDHGSTVGVVIAVARPVMVSVPNLVGMTVGNATATLTTAGLVLGVAGQRPVPGTAAGFVLDQNPAAGASIVAGSQVSVNVSAADPTVLVPDVRQQTVGAAQAILAQAGLGFAQRGTQPSVQAAGIVLSQDVVPGSRAPIGSVVPVVVSAGGLVIVPQLVGMQQAAAVQLLKSRGLGFDSVVESIFSVAPGTVIDQDESAGSQIPLGTVVVMTVATRFITGGGGSGGGSGPPHEIP
jgi:beta-lactam-binding protein with PASTA domain